MTTVQHETSPISFADMGLAESLLTSITALGYTQPTPVQAALVPAALQGGDWIVASQTGSGKTAAFLLPALQQIVNAIGSGKNNPSNAPMTLVLCPTRELAQQVSSDAINLVKNTRYSRGDHRWRHLVFQTKTRFKRRAIGRGHARSFAGLGTARRN